MTRSPTEEIGDEYNAKDYCSRECGGICVLDLRKGNTLTACGKVKEEKKNAHLHATSSNTSSNSQKRGQRREYSHIRYLENCQFVLDDIRTASLKRPNDTIVLVTAGEGTWVTLDVMLVSVAIPHSFESNVCNQRMSKLQKRYSNFPEPKINTHPQAEWGHRSLIGSTLKTPLLEYV